MEEGGSREGGRRIEEEGRKKNEGRGSGLTTEDGEMEPEDSAEERQKKPGGS